jgi:L-glutamine-phosphate cytidylyltransferase
MKAIVLAAGRGSRMYDGTAELPKCALKLFGMRLIDRCVDNLVSAGIAKQDIGIVTGYRSERVAVDGVSYFHNAAWATTNMVSSLITAEDWLRNETCIVSYSDIIFHPAVIKKLVASESDTVVPYFTGFWELWTKRFEDPLTDLENFKAANGRLLEIGGRARSRYDIHGQYMGLFRLTPTGWRNIEQALLANPPLPPSRLDVTTLLQHMLTLGFEIAAIPTEEPWLECDSQDDIRLYEREFLNLLEAPRRLP